MDSKIRLEIAGEVSPDAVASRGSVALAAAPDARITLRISIEAPGLSGLEALKHARRSILREEWTLGAEPGTPTLQTAEFSSSEIVWTVPLTHVERCLEKVAELEARANRALAQIPSRER
jgi:hypothetical protein